MKITVQRKSKTIDGIFGELTIDTNTFKCFTVENLKLSIPADEYFVNFTMSPRMQKVTPHLIVPSRDIAAGGDAGIRIHSANYPSQLQGCISVGDKIDGDMVCDSKDTFAKLFAIIKDEKDLTIDVKDIV